MGLHPFFILLYFDYLSFAHYAYIIYACVIFLLILVLCMGGAVKGSQRWFSIGSFSVQPSEFMKITLVLTLARFLRYKKYGIGLFDIGVSLLFNIHTNGAYCETARPWYGAGTCSYFAFYFIYCWYPASPPVYDHRRRPGYITFSLDVHVEVLPKGEDYWISLAGKGYGLGGGLPQASVAYCGWFGRFVRNGMEKWHRIR